MKVGFHVYLMPWFAELCLNVDGNEDWHVENRLCHSTPPQVRTAVGAESSPFSSASAPAFVIDDTTFMTLCFLNAVCVHVR